MPWEATSENLPEPDIPSPLKHMLSAHHILCQESALLGLRPQPQGGATVRSTHMAMFTKVWAAEPMTRQSPNQTSGGRVAAS